MEKSKEQLFIKSIPEGAEKCLVIDEKPIGAGDYGEVFDLKIIRYATELQMSKLYVVKKVR